jgi:phospholipid/cholesterol/gamma-HCH transport system substrate-binding protein
MNRWVRWLVGAGALTLLAAVLYASGVLTPRTVRVSAYFERTTGLYPGSDVTILGVKVGAIDAITPEGDRVRVDFHYDATQKVPADAMAAIVAPSLVADRYLQLAPGYRGGPVLADGATIALDRTAVPVEWDQLQTQLITLGRNLGPSATDPAGPAGQLITSASGALSGNGAALRDSMTQLRRAATTLATAGPNLFVTVANLNDFVSALNASGAQVHQFGDQLASVSALLKSNRDQLADVLATADHTFGDVEGFVRDNSSRLRATVSGLNEVAGQLAEQQIHLADTLHVAPTALVNVYATYDPVLSAFTGRPTVPQTNALGNAACLQSRTLGTTEQRCRGILGPLLDPFDIENLPLSVNPLIESGTANQADPAGHPPTAPPPGPPNNPLTWLLTGGKR